MSLTLVADVRQVPDAVVPAGYELRSCDRSDVAALGRLYFAAYDPGVACATVEEATDDIAASFDGEYGPLWADASSVACHDDALVAAIMTVHRAPWDDVPDLPFVIELFTDRAHRRRGLARVLTARALSACRDAGERGAALRVDAGNAPALALYRSLGLVSYSARDR